MNSLVSLLALIVGVVTFMVNDSLAITLFGVYFVLAGLIGLINGAEETSSSSSVEAARSVANKLPEGDNKEEE